MIYRFEDVELDLDTFELRRDGERVPVQPQVFEVLAHLVVNHDRLVPRTELLDVVWGDRFVSDAALASRLMAARAAVGDDGRAQRIIRTVHGRGLQLVPAVDVVDGGPAPDLIADAQRDGDPTQTVRFCTAPDGLRLATASVHGGGDDGDALGPPLVKPANWLTHVEHDWRSPVWHHWLRDLGRRRRFVRYDARGCGLSDHDLSRSPIDELDTWVDDLEAVVDGLGLDTVDLLGVSQGSAVAVGFAVRHPDRVRRLVLYGGYARGMRRRGDASADEASLLLDLMRVGWGGRNPAFRTVFTTTYLPEATSDQIRWFNELQADTTSAENAILLEQAFYDLDISETAADVAAPTLVMHAEHDMAVPYAEGRRLAAAIPGAEFVTLDSGNHILTESEPAWTEFLDRLDRFLA